MNAQETINKYLSLKKQRDTIIKELGLIPYNDMYTESLQFSIQSLNYQMDDLINSNKHLLSQYL